MEFKVTSMPGANRKIVTPYAKIMLSDRSDKGRCFHREV